MSKKRTLVPTRIGGQVVENGKVLCNPRFDFLGVWVDEEGVNIDLDTNCFGDSKFKDSFVNITLSIDDAELLVFLLQQKIKEAGEFEEE